MYLEDCEGMKIIMSQHDLELSEFELEFLHKYLVADKETREILLESNRRTYVRILLKVRLLLFKIQQ